ncbi:MAG: type VI secretion system baseplate subunit TssG [Succinivibrionaceae bacterium]
MNSITKIMQNYVSDADLIGVCQIIKHYREIVGKNFEFSFTSSMDNYYSKQPIKKITYKDDVFEISINEPALLGTLGVLPRFLNSPIMNDYNESVTASSDFIKIFEKRYYILNLLAKNKFNLARQKEEESFSKRNTYYKISDLFSCFFGVCINSDFKYLNKNSLIRYSAFLGNRQGNINTLIQLLCSYFELHFVGNFASVQCKKLSSSVLSKISSKNKCNNQLGINTQIGEKVPMFGNFLHIKIVVRDEQEYSRLFTEKNMFNAIHELISYYLGEKGGYSLSIVVNEQFLPQCKLKSISNDRLILGQNVCICTKKSNKIVEIPIKT